MMYIISHSTPRNHPQCHRVMEASAALFGALPQLLAQCWHDAQVWSRQWTHTMNEMENQVPAPHSAERHAAAPFCTANVDRLIEQAQALGYANQFFALPLALPWRSAGCLPHHQLNQMASSWGSQTAIVIGAQGETVPQGEDEIYCDRLGRIRIRFHWQDLCEQDNRSATDSASQHSSATCWVRVAQRSAGGGMGMQFLPRIGQEVLVQFLEGDMNRPIVIGALYNGQGEGGVRPTPGGHPNAAQGVDSSDASNHTSTSDQASPFAAANDHRPSAQGNLVSGNSPVWHGAASQSNDAGGHNNAAAITGIRSKEMGGAGYNQLLFDDTDSQSRIQLKTTQAATELNMGHLIHMADNYRGSFRGVGAELRTDAYGALRAGAGWLITSEGIQHQASQRDAAGDNTAGMAHVKQAVQMAKQLQQAATTHQTVGLAGITTKPTPSSASSSAPSAPSAVKDSKTSAAKDAKNSSKTSPLESLQQAVAGMVDDLPATTAPIIAVTGKAGIGMTAAQDVQWSVGDVASVMTGQGTQLISGGQFRAHSGQAIGILSGVVDGGSNAAQSNGLQLIAAKGKIQIEAHSNDMKVQAKQDINIMSSHAHIDWAAAKSISLSTEGGANITIKDGNITVQCPGKILLQAGQKSFLPAERLDYQLPVMSRSGVAPEPDRHLTSTFAFDQLTRAAKAATKIEFVALVVPIFGTDIPATTYIKLYDSLRSGAIPNAKIVLTSGGHYPAAFDNKTREILVHRAAAERAVKDNNEAWELLMALLHEFGHYIDAVLRQDLANKNADGTSTLAPDAQGDEGAKFAYEIANFDWEDGYQKPFATYTSPEFSGALKINYNAARKAIQKAQGDEAQRNEGKSGNLEHFGAGRGEHAKENPESSFGHESIEDGLINGSKIFTGTLGDAVRKQIYFGNWLRDFSQVLDPKIVRPKGLPKDLVRYLSREALTKLVALKAEIEFGENPADRKLFAVTPEILGVYRPVEHIDNPTNNDPKAVDPRTIDSGFDPLSKPEALKVDPTTSMKRYIADSREYMRSQMNKAAAAGRTPQGYREFGAGLHVLEDYFAHSNFVELSLRKLGHTNVLPWTSQAPGKHPYPLVTGMFDSEDVIASTFGMIADTLFKVKWEFQASKPGERTPSDRAMLILLDEHSDPTYLKRFQQYLLLRDKWASVPGHQYLEGAMHYTIGMVGNLYNFVYNSLLHLIANSVSDEQVYRAGDPNTNGSTDPTHSQLAKDHDNHPFHTLAASLAKEAVSKVGAAMAARWQGDATADPGAVAAGFLVHPFDCTWQDQAVVTWAKGHAKQVKRGESSTEWIALRKEHEKEMRDAIKKAGDRSAELWGYINENYDQLFGEKNQVKK